MYHFKTDSIKEKEVNQKWWLIDASQQTVGRLASKIAHMLQGKHKPYYTPHINCGDKIIVINAEKVRFTGKKMTDKTYLSHTGYPGGQRSVTPKELIKKDQAERILFLAIKRMLPKTKLQKPFLSNLFLYEGAQHQHAAQQPEQLNFT